MIGKKLQDPRNYDCLGSKNPLPAIMSELRAHWIKGVQKELIPFNMVRNTVGITESLVNSNKGKPSTLDVFKPGTPYFTVLPKIHKLQLEDIVSGVILPFRMFTDLSRGPTARADKFIAVNFLSDLQLDYCAGLDYVSAEIGFY